MTSKHATLGDLREYALRYPGAVEGIACEGTALEKRTIKAKDKAFLFLGAKDVMVKLRDSLPEAQRLAARQPDHVRPGAHGWVSVTIGDGGAPPRDVLTRWIDESYRLLAPKALVASLPRRP